MMIVSVSKFRRHWGSYLKRVADGSIIIITRRNTRVAVLAPLDPNGKILLADVGKRYGILNSDAADSEYGFVRLKQSESEV